MNVGAHLGLGVAYRLRWLEAKDPRIERDMELVLSCAEDPHAFSVEIALECCVSEASGRKKKKPKKINSQHFQTEITVV